MIQNAKDLISKGKKLNDQDLIKMGIDLLRLYDKTENQPEIKKENTNKVSSNQRYECQNCGYTMDVDKPKRKKCPKCKKYKLVKIFDTPEATVKEDFTMTKKQNNRKICFQNNWTDDQTECFDEEDLKLKKITKPSARYRQKVNMVNVKCNQCGKSEKVHPIHAPTGEARSFYLCNKCVRRQGGT